MTRRRKEDWDRQQEVAEVMGVLTNDLSELTSDLKLLVLAEVENFD